MRREIIELMAEHNYEPVTLGFDDREVHIPCGMADWAQPGSLQSHDMFGYAYDTATLRQAIIFAKRDRRGIWVRKSPKACARALKRRRAEVGAS